MGQEGVSSRVFLWTCFAVLQDGSYTFFETDSEEEEPQEGSEAEITDRQPKPRTAFQLAYKAWTDGAVCALRMRMEDEWGMGNPEWDEEGLRRRHSGGTTVDGKAGFVW
ncbi:hypothetical protein Celaphus_00007795 [Cervus elaphus hippelaphus]|uniref:Piezo TM25-28 domain-containing protein n=1 Tax=Cervus elaphus hippelaphus TaxID=46360 RepID=A0A212CAY8_CEREH|nr:hypothetical protein Celaphus_00007795 [Cervus elaphus hippelaphus]